MLWAFWFAGAGHAAPAVDCSPANGVTFICGVTNVEDWAPVTGTKWVIGSDLSTASNPQGYLYLFDTAKKTVAAVQPSEIAIQPDKTTYPDCPGPVDMKTFGPHGLELTPATGAHRCCMLSSMAAASRLKCSEWMCLEGPSGVRLDGVRGCSAWLLA